MVRAAKLAGLAPLGLINENSGAALYYGLNRLDEESKHTIILYNLGAEHLQVSLVEFSAVYNSEVPTPTKMVETVRILADDVDKSNTIFYFFLFNFAFIKRSLRENDRLITL